MSASHDSRSRHDVPTTPAWVPALGVPLVLCVFLAVGLRLVRAQEPPTTQPAATEDIPADEAPAGTEPAPADTRSSDAGSGGIEPRREPSAAEILRELTSRAHRQPRPITLPNSPVRDRVTRVVPEALPENAIEPVEQTLLPDGYRIVDRPGRLVLQEDHFVFAFESRSQGTPERPIRLLPNRLLEDMEIVSAGGSKPVVFVISGEVTEYHGMNYLLVQKLLTRPELGNIK